MPLSPPMVMSLPVPLPPSTRSSSSSALPVRSTAESPGLALAFGAGFAPLRSRGQVFVQGQVEFLELRTLPPGPPSLPWAAGGVVA